MLQMEILKKQVYNKRKYSVTLNTTTKYLDDTTDTKLLQQALVIGQYSISFEIVLTTVMLLW